MARGRNLSDLNHIYGHSYVYLLASCFGCDHVEKGITVHNRGVGGDRSADIWARWQADTLDLKPDVVSILMGINDLIRDVNENIGVSAEEYTLLLEQMITTVRAQNPNAEFVIGEPFCGIHAARERYHKIFAEKLPIHQAAAKAVAEKHGAVLSHCNRSLIGCSGCIRSWGSGTGSGTACIPPPPASDSLRGNGWNAWTAECSFEFMR